MSRYTGRRRRRDILLPALRLAALVLLAVILTGWLA